MTDDARKEISVIRLVHDTMRVFTAVSPEESGKPLVEAVEMSLKGKRQLLASAQGWHEIVMWPVNVDVRMV